MSYIAKKGRAAAESAMQEGGKDYSKALVKFKSGTTYIVRVPSLSDFVEYFNHSVFKVFYSTPCTRANGKEDLFDKAVALLYDDAKKAKDAGKEKEAEELRNQAYQLKAKPKYLFGFFDLETGEPIIIDLSKKQAQVVITAVDKFAKRVGSLAFEISKTGTGTSTAVSFIPLLDDMTATQQKNFDATAGKEFPEELYGKVLYVKNEEEQAKDLIAFGFDVGRLGITLTDEEVTPIDDNTDDDPAANF